MPAPGQGNTEAGKVAVRAGRSAKQLWPGKRNKAHRKGRYGLFIRTPGLARAEAKPTRATLACTVDRPIFHERRCSAG